MNLFLFFFSFVLIVVILVLSVVITKKNIDLRGLQIKLDLQKKINKNYEELIYLKNIEEREDLILQQSKIK